MRKITENEGNPRTNEYHFSPGSKVKEQPLPHFTSFHQETPMKPSQVPNLLSHPSPRRALPLHISDWHFKDRSDSPQHRTHVSGSLHSPGLGPGSPTNISSSVNRSHPIPKDKLGPMQHPSQSPAHVFSTPANMGSSVYKPHPTARDRPGPLQQSGQPRPKPFSSSQFSPSSPTNGNTSVNKVQPSTSSVILNHRAPYFPIDTDQKTQFSSKNPAAHSDVSNKAQPRDGTNHIPTVLLHKLPKTLLNPPLMSESSQEVHLLPSSGSERQHPAVSQKPPRGLQHPPNTQSSRSSVGGDSASMHSFNQQHEQIHPQVKFIPDVDLNSSSHKRLRESEHFDGNPKKPCHHRTDSCKTQTTKPTAGDSAATSSVCPQSSSYNSSDMEVSPKITGHPSGKRPCGQSTCSESSSTTPTQSCSTSLLSKDSSERPPSMGVRQAYANVSDSCVMKLKVLKITEENKKRTGEHSKGHKSSTLLTSELPRRDRGSLPHTGNHNSGHARGSISVPTVKTQSRNNNTEGNRKLDSCSSKSTSKPNSGSLSCRSEKQKKTSPAQKRIAVPDDTDILFTPDPITYVVNLGNNKTKPKINGEPSRLASSDKDMPCSPTDSSITSAGSFCHKPKVSSSCQLASTSVHHPQSISSSVTVKQVQHETLTSHCTKDEKLLGKDFKSDDKSPLPANDTALSGKSSPPGSSPSLLLERRGNEKSTKQMNEEDSIDVELDLDLGLSFGIDVDLTLSSNSSEDEELISFQEMMERVLKPPETPEKSEPCTPGHRSSQAKTQPLPSTSKSDVYKNSLDQMLKDINTDKKSEVTMAQLLTECKEDLLRIAEYEHAQQNLEEGISTEQQEFLQRYSLMSSTIREVPPGEAAFNLDKFGQIFDQNTLELRKCMVNPQSTTQKTLLWSSPAQLKLHVCIGLFQEAYNSMPCPTQVTRFLFKMMSVHSERIVSEKILQALCDIACSAAYQIVENGSEQFKVWVPSLADVTLVLMNMGVSFVTLFPFDDLQPPFTEGDLLGDVYIINENPACNVEPVPFPEHNCSNILKYLSYCMCLCPRAYSDEELLLILTVVSRISLDMRLTLQTSKDLYPIHCKIVNNFRDWDSMLPRICLTVTNLTDDHHNMCLLVHLLPINTRGKQLRRHLSLSMISKLLDGSCTYRPTQNEFQLSELRPYIHRMRPSSILRGMVTSSNKTEKEREEVTATPDQRSYYMCYSLLTLLNEATNFQFFPANQKEQLLLLSNELEAHVKCDIRESKKCLYRTRVKDLVARIYTKWRMLLQKTKPLNDQLYDYWQPMH